MTYTKDDLLASIQNEFRILKHLAEKIPADTEGYKPTEKQRTTLELLQYLSTSFASTAKVIKAGTADAYKTIEAHPEETTLTNFAEKMDTQYADLSEVIGSMTDEDLATVINIFGAGDKTKAVYLVENITKNLAAYKMQLFLYIKSSGNTSLNTMNLWGGIDTPAQ